MRCLVRHRVPDGSQREQSLELEFVTIGRGADMAVQLSGLLVAPLHAVIYWSKDARYRFGSPALAGADVNGISGVRNCELVPGDRIELGDHAITVGQPFPGTDLVLEVMHGQSRAGLARREARTSLRATGLSYRMPSLVLAALVLVGTLILPLVSTGISLANRSPLLPSDAMWSSGRISGGHGHFGDDCSACHQSFFVRVTDAACVTCHTRTKHHSDDPAIRQVNGFDGVRCTECHREHDAARTLTPRHPAVCTSCHADPEFAGFPDLAAAEDFGDTHPEFRPLVGLRGADGTALEEKRVQAPELRDRHGLLFNHELHLSGTGVAGPDGREVLRCDGCHVPDASRMGFDAIRFEPHCGRCHTLEAQWGNSVVQLPHANEDLLRELFRKFVRDPAAMAPEMPELAERRRRPGEAADRGERDPEFLAQRATLRTCNQCHELHVAADGLPRTQQLMLRDSWLTHARFTHGAHEAVPCAQCHAADTSRFAADLLLPTLGDCRTCHAGVDSARGVASTCIDCHLLHQARQPWSMADTKPEDVRASESREDDGP